MSKKLFIAMLVATALMAVSCDNGDDSGSGSADGPATTSDLVGSWGWNETATYVFNSNGTYTETIWENTVSGQWSLNDDVITFKPSDGEERNSKVVLTGGKAWLVLVQEEKDREKYRHFESYRKLGSTVTSGILSNGRWDNPHNGYRPEEYTEDTDYGFILVVKDGKMDMYVPMWGLRIQGAFTLSDGKLHIETDDDHIWCGIYFEGNTFGWYAYGDPRVDLTEHPELADQQGLNFNPETFALREPFEWKTVNELKAKGEKPVLTDPDYLANPHAFKYLIYEWAEGIHQEAMDLCDFNLCVAANGKEAYGGAVGLNPWLYKR